jgi:uncharacterized protein
MKSVLVAFSGGVDSSLLLAAATEACDRVVAVTVRSPLHPAREGAAAEHIAQALGVDHLTVEVDLLSEPAFRRNGPQRCYVCKRRLLSRLSELAEQRGLARVVEGSNADDRGDYRPGSRAVEELGVCSPLLDADLSKAEIRSLARERGLPNWNAPALACLATRIPYGEEITGARLRRIDRAEGVLIELGLGQVRLRDHGAVARIEVLPADLSRFLDSDLRGAAVDGLKAAGYLYVALDLEGYRVGAMNEALPPDEIE